MKATRKRQYDGDRITRIDLSKVLLPLEHAFSDAKVFAGRQQPLQHVALMFAEIHSAEGLDGLGFTYALRGGVKGSLRMPARSCR